MYLWKYFNCIVVIDTLLRSEIIPKSWTNYAIYLLAQVLSEVESEA